MGGAEQDGQPIVQNNAVLAAAFSPDGKTILIGGHDPQCRASFWDAHSLLPIGEPLRHDGSVRAVAFSPDGTLAITGSEDGTAALWNTQSRLPVGKPIQHAQTSKARQVLAVAISRDGTVATGGADRLAVCGSSLSGDPLGCAATTQGARRQRCVRSGWPRASHRMLRWDCPVMAIRFR